MTLDFPFVSIFPSTGMLIELVPPLLPLKGKVAGKEERLTRKQQTSLAKGLKLRRSGTMGLGGGGGGVLWAIALSWVGASQSSNFSATWFPFCAD